MGGLGGVRRADRAAATPRSTRQSGSSVGAGDAEGRPDPAVLQALEGYPLLHTDQNGWVELTTDGEQIWVEVERSR